MRIWLDDDACPYYRVLIIVPFSREGTRDCPADTKDDCYKADLEDYFEPDFERRI
jgi:hypothetical protein